MLQRDVNFRNETDVGRGEVASQGCAGKCDKSGIRPPAWNNRIALVAVTLRCAGCNFLPSSKSVVHLRHHCAWQSSLLSKPSHVAYPSRYEGT